MRKLRNIALVLALLVGLSLTANAQSHDHTITIRNESGNTIMRVYISPSTSQNWGADILGSSVIYNNRYWSVRRLGHVNYDIKIEESNGDECTVPRQALDQDITILVTPYSCRVLTGSSNNWSE